MTASSIAERTLLVPEKLDEELAGVLQSWEAAGGTVRRLGKYWIPDAALAERPLVVYGNQTFCLILAQLYHLELIAPDDATLAALDPRWTGRYILESRLDAAADISYPAFIKPVVPKAFNAGIFLSGAELSEAAAGLPGTERIMVAGIVEGIEAEVRAFVWQGRVLDIAAYEGEGDIDAARGFLEEFLAAGPQQPDPVVIDLLYAAQTGWAILEFNAAWGAGLNGCDAAKVLPAIAAATRSAPVQ